MYTSSSYTPNTTPSSNSSAGITPKVQINQIINEASPLFSKEQQIILKRNRAQLEIDVAALRKRKQILQDQLNHIRSDFVSYGELIQLKSSIEYNLTSKNLQDLSNSMNDYIEIVRQNYELEAQCDMLAKRIKKEASRRQNEIEISNEISNALDFSSMTIVFPNINQDIDIQKDNLLKNEIGQLQRKLENIKKDQMSNDIKVPSSNIICEAIGSYARKTETEWQLRSVGSYLIRSQIQNLQKQVVESNSFINKIQETLNKDKEKLTIVNSEANEAVAQAQSNCDSTKVIFEDQLNQMDQAIVQIKKDIERSVLNYNIIIEDIDNLTKKKISNDENDDDNQNNDDDVSNDVKDNNYIFKLNSLKEQKFNLEKEVNELKTKYQTKKSSIQKKESALKRRVTKLSNKYLFNKKLISQYAKTISIKSNNSVDKEMFSLINHIDSTINELRSTVA